jgi:hypothetical protein
MLIKIQNYYYIKFNTNDTKSFWNKSDSNYILNVKFTFNNSNIFSLDDIINDYINTTHDKIFAPSNLPDNYSSSKSDYNQIKQSSSCNLKY